ncbi:MAG TPA: ATP synthase F1 subunit gamma [Thermoleophilia bacterium]|nr:ATP synthase F1 subunit gamma [Thermoleophilia bacterium]
MATLQDIRRRIGSTQNTRKITRAMEMVSAAKLRRAQVRIEALRPYAIDMVEMMLDLATYADEPGRYALLREHEEEKAIALVVVTGDRGLAGAFNANVLRASIEIGREHAARGVEIRWMVVGRKGVGSLRFRGYDLERTWTGKGDRPSYADAQDIARHLIELYAGGQVDRVHLVYNHFKSPLEQRVMDVVVLPIRREEVYRDDHETSLVTYLHEPDAPTIYEKLLPAYVEIAVYRALLESSASEQGARMTAMRNASKNAEEMISNLTLAMNRARQASITQEILEVVAGANALA